MENGNLTCLASICEPALGRGKEAKRASFDWVCNDHKDRQER